MNYVFSKLFTSYDALKQLNCDLKWRKSPNVNRCIISYDLIVTYFMHSRNKHPTVSRETQMCLLLFVPNTLMQLIISLNMHLQFCWDPEHTHLIETQGNNYRTQTDCTLPAELEWTPPGSMVSRRLCVWKAHPYPSQSYSSSKLLLLLAPNLVTRMLYRISNFSFHETLTR